MAEPAGTVFNCFVRRRGHNMLSHGNVTAMCYSCTEPYAQLYIRYVLVFINDTVPAIVTHIL